MNWLLALAFVAGALLPVQAAVNARLGKALHSAPLATLVSFTVGLIGVLTYLAISRTALPSLHEAADAPAWAWIGGLLGAIYVLTAILAAPRIGVATLAGIAVAGQMCMSIVLDHFGLLGLPVHPVSAGRLLGVVFLGAGFVLVRRF